MQMSRRNNRNSRHFFTEAEVNERGMGSRFALGLLFPWGGLGTSYMIPIVYRYPGEEVVRCEHETSFDKLQIVNNKCSHKTKFLW